MGCACGGDVVQPTRQAQACKTCVWFKESHARTMTSVMQILISPRFRLELPTPMMDFLKVVFRRQPRPAWQVFSEQCMQSMTGCGPYKVSQSRRAQFSDAAVDQAYDQVCGCSHTCEC